MEASEDPGRLARDAYTYLHLPIIAGVILSAVGDDLLIAEPHRALHGVGPGDGPRRPRAVPAGREPLPPADDRDGQHASASAAAAALVALALIGPHVSALALSAIVTGAADGAGGVGAAPSGCGARPIGLLTPAGGGTGDRGLVVAV